jgi:FKBP-type peptidyl-prolyl cis-trans isomerase FkpA
LQLNRHAGGPIYIFNKNLMMNKIIFSLCLSLIFFNFNSCVKDEGCQNKTIQSEAGAIAAYAAANGISGITHSSGVYYQVTVPGGGVTPNPYSTVVIRYVGKLLDGTVFDSQTTTNVTLPLGSSIAGFQIALQQVQKGGTIKFMVPSSLAYGCNGYANIPGNAILYFEVQLIDVQ